MRLRDDRETSGDGFHARGGGLLRAPWHDQRPAVLRHRKAQQERPLFALLDPPSRGRAVLSR